jgi:hypothetical protein
LSACNDRLPAAAVRAADPAGAAAAVAGDPAACRATG